MGLDNDCASDFDLERLERLQIVSSVLAAANSAKIASLPFLRLKVSKCLRPSSPPFPRR